MINFSTKQKIIAAVVGLVFIGFVVFSFFKKSETDVEYRKVKIERGDIFVSVLATGTVQPENRLEIKPPIPGRIEKVLIEEGQFVKKGKILAWMSSTERAALLDAARAKGDEELARWEEIYRPTPILAPISGTIVLKNVENGQTFTGTDAILVMSDRLTVKAQVDETDISSIKLKQAAEIVLDAYPDEKISAAVDQIAFEATTVNSVTTYIVDVLPKTVPSFMRSGMTANVTFFIDEKKDILFAPSEAIKTQDGRSTVLFDSKGKQRETEVEIGITDGKRTEIISGLNEGDTILLAQMKLRGKGKGNSSSPFNPMGSRRR